MAIIHFILWTNRSFIIHFIQAIINFSRLSFIIFDGKSYSLFIFSDYHKYHSSDPFIIHGKSLVYLLLLLILSDIYYLFYQWLLFIISDGYYSLFSMANPSFIIHFMQWLLFILSNAKSQVLFRNLCQITDFIYRIQSVM